VGTVTIRSPETGRSIQTQYEADLARFRTLPVFFGHSYCPICRTDHEWFARDAWVDERSANPKRQHNFGRGSASQAKIYAVPPAMAVQQPGAFKVYRTDQSMKLYDFVRTENIARYRRLLDVSKGGPKRSIILKLLANEMDKQQEIEEQRKNTNE
jgi:hypothetical protein